MEEQVRDKKQENTEWLEQVVNSIEVMRGDIESIKRTINDITMRISLPYEAQLRPRSPFQPCPQTQPQQAYMQAQPNFQQRAYMQAQPNFQQQPVYNRYADSQHPHHPRRADTAGNRPWDTGSEDRPVESGQVVSIPRWVAVTGMKETEEGAADPVDMAVTAVKTLIFTNESMILTAIYETLENTIDSEDNRVSFIDASIKETLEKTMMLREKIIGL